MNDADNRPAVVGQVEPSVGPLACLTASEGAWLLRDPYGLRLLMGYQDQMYSEHEATCEPDEHCRWPTARWTALYERGRSIVAEDLDIWPAELLRAFGFPERPNVRAEPETTHETP
jgi:hypothetical protein